MLGVLLKLIWFLAALFTASVIGLVSLLLSSDVRVAGVNTLKQERNLVVLVDAAGTYYQQIAGQSEVQAIYPTDQAGAVRQHCMTCTPVGDLHAVAEFCFAAVGDEQAYRFRQPCPSLFTSGSWLRAFAAGFATLLLLFGLPAYLLRRKRRASQSRAPQPTVESPEA